MKTPLEIAIDCHARLAPADAEDVEMIAMILSQSETPDLTAYMVAAKTIQHWRERDVTKDAWAKAHALPVRQAKPSGEGGGRYYWRLQMADGSVLSAVKDDSRQRGNVQTARRYAAEQFVKGREVSEMIPPDFDPQDQSGDGRSSATGYWRRNVTAARSKPGVAKII